MRPPPPAVTRRRRMARHLVAPARPARAGGARRLRRAARSSRSSPGGPRWLASMLELREPGRPREAPALPLRRVVRRRVPLARLHRVLPAWRPARAAKRRPTGCRGARWRTASSRGPSPSPPRASARGICSSPPPDRLSGIFPPGYPLLLAPAFLVGAPMLVGPLLAARLVVATWLLARELALERGRRPRREPSGSARVAAGLSILSAALRYHTADALPYGAPRRSRVAMALGLRAARAADGRAAPLRRGRARRRLPRRDAAGVGHRVGVVVAVARGRRRRARARASLAGACGAALPGRLLLLAAQPRGGRPVPSRPRWPSYCRAAFEPHPPFSPRAAAIATAAPPARAPARRRQLRADRAPARLLLRCRASVHRRRRDSRRWSSPGHRVLSSLAPLAPARRRRLRGAGASLLVAVVPVEHALIALALAPPVAARWLAPAVVAFAPRARRLRGARVPRPREPSRRATSGARATSRTSRARPTSRTACSSSTTTRASSSPTTRASRPATTSRPCACAATTTIGCSTTCSATRQTQRYIAHGDRTVLDAPSWTPPGGRRHVAVRGRERLASRRAHWRGPCRGARRRRRPARPTGTPSLVAARRRRRGDRDDRAARPARARRRPSATTWVVTPRVIPAGRHGRRRRSPLVATPDGPPAGPVDLDGRARRPPTCIDLPGPAGRARRATDARLAGASRPTAARSPLDRTTLDAPSEPPRIVAPVDDAGNAGVSIV